ncbi:probable starch synthase 4, chloroplastic/amyloplastic [Neltuma alba]|uniref:probable starch synthase 4, chloroplastic/amyloplastic n=1 Tax=Neltuma alba TaxID=207710 RepID=UPI0010A5933E|nr:probable starch synthase 4, chloroplastic/amyloplastic [Prosopis alba]
MTTQLPTCFSQWNTSGLNSISTPKLSNVLCFPLQCRRLLPASCRVGKQDHNFQPQNQPIKKVPEDRTSADGDFLPVEYVDSNKEHSGSTNADAEQSLARNFSLSDITPLAINKDVAKLREEPLGTQLQNLLEMIRYVEKDSDIYVLKQARVRSLEDLQNILYEREVLQRNVEILEKRLAETEAQLKVADQEKENLSEMLSTLRIRSKDLRDGIENSQLLLHRETKQADKPTTALQRNHDLQRKVEELSTPDVEPADHMPWEFWSQLLLIIDGWSLEKKISIQDAKVLREKVWKRDRCILETFMAVKEQSEDEIISALLATSATSSGLHVVHIAAEMAPVAKVGGLADVVGGLCKALQKSGHLVEIILPKYDCMRYDRISGLRALDAEIHSYFDGQLYKNKIWVGTVEGLPVYFIEPVHYAEFFRRGRIYGEHDDFKRFSCFSRAALEFLHQSGKKPDIIHCHDWHTAFVAPLYWEVYVPMGLNSARVCFTCHNFEYQGTAPASELSSCGLDPRRLNTPDRLQDNKAHDRVNLVKGGIVFSNIVTTVSPTYAQQLQTMEDGQGLHSTLRSQSHKFFGILNGIDTDAWNPNTDTYLKVHFNASYLQGKSKNKDDLRRKLGLSSVDARMPLVGCVTRLVPHKGVFLIRHAIYRTLEMGGQFVLLGSSPIPKIQEEFEKIARNFQDHDHVRLILTYDESLSHLIYAASDMLVIPSIIEPCGLTPMIAMRYGAIPVARKTGGINDSVFDVEDNTVPYELRNGFTFLKADEQGLDNALKRAFQLYKRNPESWDQLVRKDMNMDFSWKSSAAQFEELYCDAVARAKRRNMLKRT